MTAKRATEAFCIIQERQYEIDLILAEGCLPDMDKYELLETMRKISKLPVVRKQLPPVLFSDHSSSIIKYFQTLNFFANGIYLLLLVNLIYSHVYRLQWESRTR